MKPTIIDRKTGHYGVSISTSLAFEGLFHTGDHADMKGKIMIDEYDAVYLNLRTLFRNAYYSFEQHRDHVDAYTIVEAVLADVVGITDVINEVRKGVKVVTYLCKYDDLNREFKNVKFRDATTHLQLVYNELEKEVYKTITEKYEVEEFETYPECELSTILVTHFPLDLIESDNRFPKVALLESHTGKLKRKNEWYTKLNSKSKNIPFCKAMLIIFGDNVMFSPQDLKVRNVIKKASEKYDWNQQTTRQRMEANLRLMNEPHVIDFLRKNW